MTSEKDIITGTRKLGMTANINKDGKLISEAAKMVKPVKTKELKQQTQEKKIAR